VLPRGGTDAGGGKKRPVPWPRRGLLVKRWGRIKPVSLSTGLTGRRYRLTTIWVSPGIELFRRVSSHAPFWAGRNNPSSRRLWKSHLFLALMRIRYTASLLGPAARGAVRLLMESALATPRRVYIGAGVAALTAGIGASALQLQIGSHPARLLAPATHDLLPASAHTAAPAGTSTAAPPAAGESRAIQVSAPDITSSIEPATQDEQHKSKSVGPPAALAPDQIGAFLHDKSHDGGSNLVRIAQIALGKLGYAVKFSGAEDSATRRALRHFERAHGLAPTTEISPELVKQLTAAAGG
jgi:hypothetical protein